MDMNTDVKQSINEKTNFCKHCGKQISEQAVVCPICGCQVEELHKQDSNQPIIINNNNVSSSSASAVAVSSSAPLGKAKSKWVAFFLCLFLGYFGIHKFYEGKVGMGILYLCTAGLFVFGVIVDLIAILGKPNTYYV